MSGVPYFGNPLASLAPQTAAQRLTFFRRLHDRLATDDALRAIQGDADLRRDSTVYLLGILVTAQVRFAEAQLRDRDAAAVAADPAPVQSEPHQ